MWPCSDLAGGRRKLIEDNLEAVEQANAVFEEHGVGAASLPLDSPFVVSGNVLQWLYEDDDLDD